MIAFTTASAQCRKCRAFCQLTTPEQAAEVFKRTKPKLAVYSHIALGNSA